MNEQSIVIYFVTINLYHYNSRLIMLFTTIIRSLADILPSPSSFFSVMIICSIISRQLSTRVITCHKTEISLYRYLHSKRESGT